MSVSGTWINAYDSRMELTQYPDSGLVTGTYSSTTGSTGRYNVLGYATSTSPTVDAGETLGLAIFWRSINSGDPEDNSWHWVSGLGGRLSRDPAVLPSISTNAWWQPSRWAA